jgi:glycosyltransferase involved in cell wall biosynthesis
MKSLLLINYEYPPVGGGAGNATFHIARSFVSHCGYKVTVLTARYRGLRDASEGNLSVVRCPALRHSADRSGMIEKFSFIPGAMFALPGIVKRNKFDGCIAFFSIPCGPVALFAKALYGIPYVISLRGGDVPGNEKGLGLLHAVLTSLRRAVLAHARAIVANSEGLKRAAESADHFPVRVIPNGVDTNFFSPGESSARGDAVFRLLFAGRFQVEKNPFVVLEQFAALRAAFPAEQRVELHLVGDGPLRANLAATAERLGIAVYITWYGWLDKKALLEVYRQCDCFLNPSLYEGSPNAVLEAMACGLPVIASDCMGNNDVVTHGETGFLFDLSEPSAVVQRAGMLIRDRALAMAMGEKARRKVEADFSWDKVAEAYAALVP